MSFEKIETTVLAKAKADAETIISGAREKGERELALFREETVKEIENAIHGADIAAALETNRQLSIARHEGRIDVLTAKNKVIETVILRATEKLRSLDEKEYYEMLEEWLRHLPPDIGGIICINPRDEKLVNSRFIETLNAGRPATGRLMKVEFDSKIDRGFIIIGENFTADFTLNVLIKKVRDSSIGDLAKELFKS